MADVRSTIITPISVYCFFLGFVPLALDAITMIKYNVNLFNADFGMWLAIIASVIFAACLAAVGVGFHHLNALCWKILFFCLAICVSSVAALLLIFSVSLLLGVNPFSSFFQVGDVPSSVWFGFFVFFISEIMILYFLTRSEVTSSFEMLDERLSPF